MRSPPTHHLLDSTSLSHLTSVDIDDVDEDYHSQSNSTRTTRHCPLSPVNESVVSPLNSHPVLTPSQRSLLRPNRLRSIDQEVPDQSTINDPILSPGQLM